MKTIRVKVRRDPLQTAIRIILSAVCFVAFLLPTWPMASDGGVILTGFQLAEASLLFILNMLSVRFYNLNDI